MNRMFRYLVAGVSLCLAVGCGSPSASDLCHTTCDNEKKCGRANDAQTANCHTSCNNNAGTLMQQDQNLAMSCTNPGDLRQQQAACFGNTDACNVAALGACQLAVINNCIKR